MKTDKNTFSPLYSVTCHEVLELAHNNESVEDRVAAIKLLSTLALRFGRDMCEHIISSEMMAMADDPEQNVRKAAIQNFLKVCEAVSNEFFIKKLLPVYQKYL